MYLSFFSKKAHILDNLQCNTLFQNFYDCTLNDPYWSFLSIQPVQCAMCNLFYLTADSLDSCDGRNGRLLYTSQWRIHHQHGVNIQQFFFTLWNWKSLKSGLVKKGWDLYVYLRNDVLYVCTRKVFIADTNQQIVSAKSKREKKTFA